MKILALEFSSPQRSVAVVNPTGSRSQMSEVIETGTQSSNPIGMIDSALRQAEIEREQIECLVLGVGPGSYTGIRLAISIAQGWQLASRQSVKLLGISSAEALAVQAQSDGLTGRFNIVIDAQRGELYVAVYEVRTESCREVAPLKLLP